MRPLSYEPRGNLSKFISLIICAIPQYIKNILALERLFPRVICPFCPVFFVSESPISFDVKELNVVWFDLPDNGLMMYLTHVFMFKPMSCSISKINQTEHYRHFGKDADNRSKRRSAL